LAPHADKPDERLTRQAPGRLPGLIWGPAGLLAPVIEREDESQNPRVARLFGFAARWPALTSHAPDGKLTIPLPGRHQTARKAASEPVARLRGGRAPSAKALNGQRKALQGPFSRARGRGEALPDSLGWPCRLPTWSCCLWQDVKVPISCRYHTRLLRPCQDFAFPVIPHVSHLHIVVGPFHTTQTSSSRTTSRPPVASTRP